MPRSIPEVVVPVARLRHVGVDVDHVVLQCHRRGGELPCRSGRIQALQRLVVERLLGIGAQRLVVGEGHAADELVRVIAGVAVQRKHFAVVRVHGDGAAHERIREELGHVQLQVEIDVRLERSREHGLPFLRSLLAHDSAARIHLDVAAALAAVEHRLVFLLEPLLSDLLTGLVRRVFRKRQLGFIDFIHEPDERRDRRTIRIEPLRRRHDDQAGKVDAMLLEHGHDVERGVVEDDRRPGGSSAIAAHRKIRLLRSQLNGAAQTSQRSTQRILRLRQHRDGISDDVLRDDLSLSVVDRATRGRDRHFAQPVLLRHQHPLLIAENLRPEKCADQEENQPGADDRRGTRAARDVVGMKAQGNLPALSSRFPIPLSLMPSAPRGSGATR